MALVCNCRRFARCLALGSALACLISPSAQAETLEGRIVRVADGDTLTLLTAEMQQVKIRLAGIDAPEKRQDFGQRAKASLSEMAFDKEAKADCSKLDRYQRHICVVTVGGTDVGLLQVQSGMAWWYRQYQREQSTQQRIDYERAESKAKADHLGLWVLSDPVPPWEWRKSRHSGSAHQF